MRRPPAGRSLDDALEVPAPEPGPEADAVASQRRARLHRAIRELPLGMRQVLTLALEGLSNREVGEVLGISDNAVAIRLTRARQALRDRLQPERRDVEEACVAAGPRAGRGEVACK
jgi:RNA polymerase sigma-70 factor (ECF subfamily)